MRLSLLLFTALCLVCNIANAQSIRLKSLQFGPTLAIQFERQDTTVADLRKLVKDPLHFPVTNVDTFDVSPGRSIFYRTGSSAQFSLLTTWEFYSKRKEEFDLQKELRFGVEYSYYGHNGVSLDAVHYPVTEPGVVNNVSFRRNNHFLALYTDFILKKGFSHNRIFLFAGAGGYVAQSISGNIVENRRQQKVGNEDIIAKYTHATDTRRDVAVLFPMGIDMRSGNPRRPLGVSLGMRPGFVIVKEKSISAFTSGMLGFTARMVYHFH